MRMNVFLYRGFSAPNAILSPTPRLSKILLSLFLFRHNAIRVSANTRPQVTNWERERQANASPFFREGNYSALTVIRVCDERQEKMSRKTII